MMPKLILASGSPRRKDLLTEAGYDFQVIVPDVEENEDVSVPIRQLTKENAELNQNFASALRFTAMNKHGSSLSTVPCITSCAMGW